MTSFFSAKGKPACIRLGLQIKYWQQRGKKDYNVYKYHLRRCPGQGALATQRVEFGGVGAPKTHSASATHDLVDRDMSGGKEPIPVSLAACPSALDATLALAKLSLC